MRRQMKFAADLALIISPIFTGFLLQFFRSPADAAFRFENGFQITGFPPLLFLIIDAFRIGHEFKIYVLPSPSISFNARRNAETKSDFRSG